MTGASEFRRRHDYESSLQDGEDGAVGVSPTLPLLFSPETVAKAFELPSPNWLVEAARDKRIPHTRLGRRLRFTREQVERAIQVHQVEAVVELHLVEPATPELSQQHRRSRRFNEDLAQPRRLRPRTPSRMRNVDS